MLKKNHPILSVVNSTFADLATPKTISYMWNFGSMLGVCLILQIVTGLLMAIHYCSNNTLAFEVIMNVTRNMDNSFMIRCLHANGASLMFMCLYPHISRGMFNKSFSNSPAWASGVILIFITMATAFLGYVLPWGQMSFWGASVITNLLSAIPYVGNDLVKWLWGGYSVDNPTLSRFFSFHFILPMIVALLAMIHLIMIHEMAATNPASTKSSTSKIPFHPFFIVKDSITLLSMVIFLMIISTMKPFSLMDPDNFILANPMVTPAHIQPEWYFLFAYAILRSIPNKLGGVMALVASIAILLILPMTSNSKMMSTKFYPMNKMMFWLYSAIFCLLTWGGAQLVEQPMIITSQITSTIYFTIFILNPLTLMFWDMK